MAGTCSRTADLQLDEGDEVIEQRVRTACARPRFLAPSPRFQLVFEPLDLLARLAAIVPRPRVDLILYHGVLAPNAGWRAAVVSYAPSAVEPPLAAAISTATDAPSVSGTASLPSRRNWTWAQLMQRAFDVDVLLCRACDGRLRLIAIILDPRTIRGMLRSLGLATEATRSPNVMSSAAPPTRSLSRSTVTPSLVSGLKAGYSVSWATQFVFSSRSNQCTSQQSSCLSASPPHSNGSSTSRANLRLKDRSTLN